MNHKKRILFGIFLMTCVTMYPQSDCLCGESKSVRNTPNYQFGVVICRFNFSETISYELCRKKESASSFVYSLFNCNTKRRLYGWDSQIEKYDFTGNDSSLIFTLFSVLPSGDSLTNEMLSPFLDVTIYPFLNSNSARISFSERILKYNKMQSQYVTRTALRQIDAKTIDKNIPLQLAIASISGSQEALKIFKSLENLIEDKSFKFDQFSLYGFDELNFGIKEYFSRKQ